MNVFFIISPLVIVAVLGYIAAKTNWLNKSQLDALSKFTFNLSIPAFLFYQMANADLAGKLNLNLFAAFYLPVLLCYAMAALCNYFFHQQQGKSNAASAVFALGASYSNTVIVGLPILLLVLGEQVVAIVFLIVSFHSAMLFALTGAIAASGKSFNWLNFIRQTLKNPLILSISCGLVVNLLALPIPTPIADSLALMGKPAITLALFCLGASLAYYQVRSELVFISLASLFKLVLLPALVYVSTVYIFALDPIVSKVLVILSACPTGVNAYLIAKIQGKHQQTVAGTVVITSVFCVITLPLWLAFLGLDFAGS
jgi:malonate transporter